MAGQRALIYTTTQTSEKIDTLSGAANIKRRVIIGISALGIKSRVICHDSKVVKDVRFIIVIMSL